MFNQQLMNMKIQLKYLQNRTSNIRQDYIRKRYREAINHPLIDFTMRSLYCILPIDRPNFITLSHLFMKVDLNIKVKGYYIKLLHPTNRNSSNLPNADTQIFFYTRPPQFVSRGYIPSKIERDRRTIRGTENAEIPDSTNFRNRHANPTFPEASAHRYDRCFPATVNRNLPKTKSRPARACRHNILS